MKKLMNFLMLSCKKAAALIDKKLEVKLSWKQKSMLKIHTAMCNSCSSYEKQSLLINKILHKHIHASSNENEPVIENKELKKNNL